MFARLDKLNKADQVCVKIADTVIAGQVRSLNKVNTSISTATKWSLLRRWHRRLSFRCGTNGWIKISRIYHLCWGKAVPDNDCNFELNNEMILSYEAASSAVVKNRPFELTGCSIGLMGDCIFGISEYDRSKMVKT